MTLQNALIGYSGFVGNTLLKQTTFTHLYRSTNILDIQGQKFDTIVCAGAPAQKWLANKNPQADYNSIQHLINCLQNVKCRLFILISTVDVFKEPIQVSESTSIDPSQLQPYGLHRYQLEQFVQQHFSHSMVVRLPGLVGPGLRKNIIFDFLNQNNLQTIDSRGVFQFYPMVNLWADITTALKHNIPLIHLTSEPIDVGTIASEAFQFTFTNQSQAPAPYYDMQTIYGQLYNKSNASYQYDKSHTLLACRAYAQSEPKTIKD